MYKKIWGSFLLTIGYLLSPLSWWNDLFVNVPLAYIFSIPFSFLNEGLFLPSFIFGYLLTNLLGFYMMHKGVNSLRKKIIKKGELKKDLIISLIYVLLISISYILGWIKAPVEYLHYFR